MRLAQCGDANHCEMDKWLGEWCAIESGVSNCASEPMRYVTAKRTLELEPRLIDPTLIRQYFPDFKLKVEEVKAEKSTRAWPAWPWPGLPWQPGLAFAAAR